MVGFAVHLPAGVPELLVKMAVPEKANPSAPPQPFTPCPQAIRHALEIGLIVPVQRKDGRQVLCVSLTGEWLASQLPRNRATGKPDVAIMAAPPAAN